MAKKAIPSERLTPSNLDKVIKLLEAEKPITKKSACEILGIAYNTTRLQNLIEAHKQKVENDRIQQAKKRGTPATTAEIQYIIQEYLSGAPVTDISAALYRSAVFVKNVLNECGCPIRSQGSHYFSPDLIPEVGIKEDYEPGEKCYAVRYQSLATIRERLLSNNNIVYRVWLEGEEWQQFAYQPWWELARLDTLSTKYGVSL